MHFYKSEKDWSLNDVEKLSIYPILLHLRNVFYLSCFTTVITAGCTGDRWELSDCLLYAACSTIIASDSRYVKRLSIKYIGKKNLNVYSGKWFFLHEMSTLFIWLKNTSNQYLKNFVTILNYLPILRFSLFFFFNLILKITFWPREDIGFDH